MWAVARQGRARRSGAWRRQPAAAGAGEGAVAGPGQGRAAPLRRDQLFFRNLPAPLPPSHAPFSRHVPVPEPFADPRRPARKQTHPGRARPDVVDNATEPVLAGARGLGRLLLLLLLLAAAPGPARAPASAAAGAPPPPRRALRAAADAATRCAAASAAGAAAAALATGARGGRSLLIEGGRLLALDAAGTQRAGAAVLVEDGVIKQVGRDGFGFWGSPGRLRRLPCHGCAAQLIPPPPRPCPRPPAGQVGSKGELRAPPGTPVLALAPEDVVLPGLVNAHTHAAMTLLRGVGNDLDLQDWCAPSGCDTAAASSGGPCHAAAARPPPHAFGTPTPASSLGLSSSRPVPLPNPSQTLSPPPPPCAQAAALHLPARVSSGGRRVCGGRRGAGGSGDAGVRDDNLPGCAGPRGGGRRPAAAAETSPPPWGGPARARTQFSALPMPAGSLAARAPPCHRHVLPRARGGAGRRARRHSRHPRGEPRRAVTQLHGSSSVRPLPAGTGLAPAPHPHLTPTPHHPPADLRHRLSHGRGRHARGAAGVGGGLRPALPKLQPPHDADRCAPRALHHKWCVAWGKGGWWGKAAARTRVAAP
jgi:hypothetical protein